MTKSPNKPEKTVLDMIKVVVGEHFLNTDCDDAITAALNPTTMLVGVRHKSAIDKLHAMSKEGGWNRMRVGSCFGDGVECWILRTGDDEFTMEYLLDPVSELDMFFDPEYIADMLDIELGEDMSLAVAVRRRKEGLTAAQVVEHVGEHAILHHEIFELPSGLRFGDKML